ncbi:MAG: radical SAM family heme chaperone HemW [Sphingobacteriaceae bacterium]|nr:radical SAM family heme chaperone HemW [Cytophagaceae bacterium]
MHVYVHIPFCAQACYYCDFHFSTQLAGRAALVEALTQEVALQRNFLPKRPLETIYFGGGTPSLLTEAELARLLDSIHAHFAVIPEAEITLEANPDDLTTEKLAQFRSLGVNRLSIGIQSFNEGHLRHLHRLHNAAEGEASVKRAQDAGFENLSIDLIYAIVPSHGAPPGSTAENHDIWQRDLQKASALTVPHISAYCLTIEPQTVFGSWLKKAKIQPIDDAFAARQFELLTEHLTAQGYEHYEISNFAQPGRYSRHNTSYWRQEPYLGLGPSAHSFDGNTTRQANVSHNTRYVEAIGRGEIPAEMEHLSEPDRVNEYLLTSLRTQWGCELEKLRAISEQGFTLVQSLLPPLFEKNWLMNDGGFLRLTSAGKLFADRVASELFWV